MNRSGSRATSQIARGRSLGRGPVRGPGRRIIPAPRVPSVRWPVLSVQLARAQPRRMPLAMRSHRFDSERRLHPEPRAHQALSSVPASSASSSCCPGGSDAPDRALPQARPRNRYPIAARRPDSSPRRSRYVVLPTSVGHGEHEDRAQRGQGTGCGRRRQAGFRSAGLVKPGPVAVPGAALSAHRGH